MQQGAAVGRCLVARGDALPLQDIKAVFDIGGDRYGGVVAVTILRIYLILAPASGAARMITKAKCRIVGGKSIMAKAGHLDDILVKGGSIITFTEGHQSDPHKATGVVVAYPANL